MEIPDYADRLPQEIREFTQHGVYDQDHEHPSFVQGGVHGGSHPHLVHEFLSSIIEHRPPAVDQFTAANWTAVGIAAHRSAMNDGEWITLPEYTRRSA